MVNGKYDKIINLPHKQSNKRPHMSCMDRAAQFAPFAALTGYDDAIKETGRITNERMEMSEETQKELNEKFQILSNSLGQNCEITFVYFRPDERKDGGVYEMVRGIVKKICNYERLIVLKDGTKIPVDEVYSMDGELFHR